MSAFFSGSINLDTLIRSFNEKDKKECSKKIAVFMNEKYEKHEFTTILLEKLKCFHEVRKVMDADMEACQSLLEWAEVCYFLNLSEFLISLSGKQDAESKFIICRINEEDIASEMLGRIKWENIKAVYCESELHKALMLERVNIEPGKFFIIHEGVNVRNFSYRKREKGFNIGYYGFINFESGSMMLLQAFKAIVDFDNRYRLHLSGFFTDERDVLYYRQMLMELRIEKNVIIEDNNSDMDAWFENLDYIICINRYTFNNELIAKAMCKGIMPLIHNFYGTEYGIPFKYRWNSVKDLIEMIKSEEYNSKEYADLASREFSCVKNAEYINSLIYILSDVDYYQERLPLVTVGITNYNYGKYISKCIESVLDQTYKNIELLIVDDCSSDNSANIIRSYEQRFVNIKGIYNSQNSGSGLFSIRKVIDNLSGKYFSILDADDYFPNKYVIDAYMNKIVKNPEVDYVYANRVVVDIEGNYGAVWSYKNYRDDDIVSQIFERFGSGVIPMYGMFKTEFYKKNNTNWHYDEDVKIGYDTLNCLVNIKKGWNHEYIDQILLCYRQHTSNISYNVKTRIQSLNIIIQFIIDNFNEKIYFNKIKWEDYSEKDKQSLRNLLLGMYYFNFYKIYYTGNWKPWDFNLSLNKDQMIDYLTPIENTMNEYFNNCIELTNQFISDINKIKDELKLLKELN